MTSGEPDFSPAWRDYRRRLRVFVVTSLMGLPVAAMLWFAASNGRLLQVALAVLAAWFIAFCVATLRLQLFPCPRCSRPFLLKWFYAWPLAGRQCVHCGLRNGAS